MVFVIEKFYLKKKRLHSTFAPFLSIFILMGIVGGNKFVWKQSKQFSSEAVKVHFHNQTEENGFENR